MEPEAKAIHKRSLQSKENEFLIGFKESQNRKLIFRDNCRKSIKNYIRFYWANIGWTSGQVLLRNPSRAFGMVRGLLSKT